MVTLRELARKDIPFVNKWRHDKSISDFLGGNFRYLSIDQDERWFEDYLKNRNTQVRCAIYVEASRAPVGVVYLTGIDQVNRSAEFGIMIGNKKYQGQGIGTAATRKMLEHAFLNLNLRRVFLTVLSDNIAALKLYQKMGFAQEGTLREAAYKNGLYKDLFLMSILRDEFTISL